MKLWVLKKVFKMDGISGISRIIMSPQIIASLRKISFVLSERSKRLVARQKTPFAVSLSIGLHLMILLLFMSIQTGFMGGGVSGVGIGDGNRFNVSLASMPIDNRLFVVVEPEASEATEFIITPADIAVAETSYVLDKLSQQTPQLSEISPSEATESNDPSSNGNDGQGDEASDDLWSAIAPCWSRVADKNTQDVILEVSFSATGGLSKPPVIVRDNHAAIDPQRLQSESKALSALVECGAYAMVKGQENVKVTFPRP